MFGECSKNSKNVKRGKAKSTKCTPADSQAVFPSSTISAFNKGSSKYCSQPLTPQSAATRSASIAHASHYNSEADDASSELKITLLQPGLGETRPSSAPSINACSSSPRIPKISINDSSEDMDTTATSQIKSKYPAAKLNSIEVSSKVFEKRNSIPSNALDYEYKILVFVNPKSGGKQGVRILKKFEKLLEPRQLYDLTEVGPMPGLQAFSGCRNLRILCCGGDGTAGWLLETMDQMNWDSSRPPVAVLPLGTGNDLARCLRWGSGFDGSGLTKILRKIQQADVVYMDRWKITLSDTPSPCRRRPTTSNQVTPSLSQPAFATTSRTVFASTKHTQPDVEKGDPIPYSIFNNYFSVGVDALICHRFHIMREKHPERFNSRIKNKIWYLEFSAFDTFSSSCRNLHRDVDVMCDGVSLDLANGPALEAIALLNIPSTHGGSNLWGANLPTRSSHFTSTPTHHQQQHSCNSIDFVRQHMGDGLIEVVGLTNLFQAGQVRAGLRSSARRLAQCSSVVIRSRKLLPMQIDGEPWMQQPCTIHISRFNQVPMLMAPLSASKLGSFFNIFKTSTHRSSRHSADEGCNPGAQSAGSSKHSLPQQDDRNLKISNSIVPDAHSV